MRRTTRLTLVFDEFRHAQLVAEAVLDEHEGNPDCDLAILARQFLLLVKRKARATARMSATLKAI